MVPTATACSPKSPDDNIQAYDCFAESVLYLDFYAMRYFHQPFEDLTKIKQEWVHFNLFWTILAK
jgi:hypothetical protein